MSVIDLLARALSGPAGRVVEAPVRDIVDEVLRSQDVVRPAELQALRGELRGVNSALEALKVQIGALSKAVDGVREAQGALRSDLEEVRSRPAPAPAIEPAVEAPSEIKEGAPRADEAPAEPAPADEAAADLGSPAQGPSGHEADEEASAEQAPSADEGAEEPGGGERPVGRPRNTTGCRVPGCERSHRARGFCSPHYQQWRRGVLEGFVSPEGVALVGGLARTVGSRWSGEPYTVVDGEVHVEGHGAVA